jgi:UDPglucose 6-dehydrogenase
MNKQIGIIGFGWVGKAMKELFPDAIVYDPFITETVTQAEINDCDVAFICVPTPCPAEGRLDTSIVEESVAWCKCPLLVIRSTVNPGDCGNWSQKYKKNIVMQPEYLGETVAHPMTDQKARPFLIIGGSSKDCRKLIEIYQGTYNANISIRQVTQLEAEIIKISENRAIAFKVAQCQELYDVCELAEVDYYTIRDAVYGDDPRFNLWWTFVYPKKRGFQSKCIPKDIFAWCAWAESLGYNPTITKRILNRNKKWLSMNSQY